MENIPPGEKTNQPQQFIGYWGYGSRRELEAQLNMMRLRWESGNKGTTEAQRTQRYEDFRDIFDKSSMLKKLHISFEKLSDSAPIWNVIYIGNSPRKIFSNHHPELLAGISASGIETELYTDIWVKLQGTDLILGREPFGKVPLYWMQQGQVIWFASRLQLLLSVMENPEVNIPALYGYSCFSYVPNPLTPVSQIFAVTAGEELVWQSQSESQRLSAPVSQRLSEWCEAAVQIKDETTAVQQLQTLLKQAIQRQISDLTDEPVGVFLSGGLDSAVVAALLVQAGIKVIGYTLDFGNYGISESLYAEMVAQHLQIPLVKVDAKPEQIQKALISTVQALDLPFGDGVTVPLFLLGQRASQDTRVIFNGEGGDQLFAGWTNKPLIAAGVYQSENLSMSESFIQQYLRTFHRLWGYEAQIYQPDIYEQIQNLHPEDWITEALNPEYSTAILHRLRRAGLMLKGSQNIHPRATALGFAHGLYVRSPFCDLPLAEWTFQLSGELCLKASCEKYILKRSVENLLPSEIVWRQKRGMGVPLTSWCLDQFWPHIGKWLNPGKLRLENRFSPHLAAEIAAGKLGAHIQGRRIGEILWLLIMWQLWRVYVLGEESGKASFDHPFWLPQTLWRLQKKWQN
ncbi:asparagine synthetase B family protein [Nodularia harveyana UHCC-0300]|uniref:asparagine synthase (glutamine-hydrolyzing) n=1 Tax=Nodularia harveyana UHCC-0300 TaxID=2974287 RepID=A0ABU5UD08_9CYAN|nr:asparagine synthetase B family protein [Nodularia harveyana]MEA5581034.1 asparagine synthetase B family protein [Nodularia harveyana UHCC-0300]